MTVHVVFLGAFFGILMVIFGINPHDTMSALGALVAAVTG